MKKQLSVKSLVFIALFAALAVLLMTFKVPVFFAPSFYKLDFSEIPVLVSGMTMGPVPGVLVAAIKVLINFVIDGPTTGGIGELANFLMSCAIVLPLAIIYRRKKTGRAAVAGGIAGVVTLIVVASLLNVYLLLPTYANVFGMPMEALVGMGAAINPSVTGLFSFALWILVPFNLLKGGVSMIVALLLRKRMEKILR
ncbi:MAG: ECF transporter S component [Clostridia bacterium]|nr:ECF transporter S component [Clostridia bacterium]